MFLATHSGISQAMPPKRFFHPNGNTETTTSFYDANDQLLREETTNLDGTLSTTSKMGSAHSLVRFIVDRSRRGDLG